MSSAQKTPIARTLNQFAERKVRGALDLLGKGLPASVTAVSGSIVTVKFEIANTVSSPYTLPPVTMPIAGSQWARAPTQIGDMGVVLSADTVLGGVSGLGGGVADLSLHANLSSLVFFPIGNSGWSPTDDPNSWVIYGPDGVILRDSNKKTTLTLTPAGIVISLQSGDAVTINGNLIVNGNMLLGGAIQSQTGSTYAGNIETSGNVVGGAGSPGSTGLLTHEHSGVSTGSGDSGPPVGGT